MLIVRASVYYFLLADDKQHQAYVSVAYSTTLNMDVLSLPDQFPRAFELS